MVGNAVGNTCLLTNFVFENFVRRSFRKSLHTGKITSTDWVSMNRLTLSSLLRIRSPTRRKLILLKANYETERLFIATDLVVVGASVVDEVFVSPAGVAPEAKSLTGSADFGGQFNSDFAIFDFLNLSVSASDALMQTSCFTT